MEAAALAAAVAVEQVVSTTAQVGIYGLAKPTLPLKASVSRIAANAADDGSGSLRRCNHSLKVLHGKAYVFGGERAANDHLCSNEMHIISLPDLKHSPGPDYQCLPALSNQDGGQIPPPQKFAQTRASGDKIEFYGGTNESGQTTNDNEAWSFDTNTLKWSLEQSNSIAQPSQAITAPTDFVQAGKYLYSLKPGSDGLSTTVQYRQVDEKDWQTHTIPKNPLVPGPSIRKGASHIVISTGMGRNYLIFLYDLESPDMWALQLHSDESSLSSTKDSARDKIEVETGLFEWAQVEIKDPEDEAEDRALPGRIAMYAVDKVTPNEVLLSGGVDAGGQVSGDLWLIKFE